MAVPKKNDKAFEDLWNPNSGLSPQETADAMANYLLNDPETFEADSKATGTTPDNARSGNVWAPITYYPTSTSNPAKPRTVGAGYDRENYILTIQFRDGTLYNYYDVPEYIWMQFRYAPSKGQYMQIELDMWDEKGPVTGHSAQYYSKKYKKARAQQQADYAPIDFSSIVNADRII
jgi:hypothetical protein